jgi:hypothetical protein
MSANAGQPIGSNGSPQPPPQAYSLTSRGKSFLGGMGTVVGAVLKYPTRILAQGAVEGALDGLTNRIQGSNGPIDALRKKVNSVATPQLKEAKNAMEAYRLALESNSANLIPILKTLHTTLFALLAKKSLVPEFTPAHWMQLENFANEVQKRMANPNPLPPRGQLLAETKAPWEALIYGFKAQHGLVEESVDNFVQKTLGHLTALPSQLMNAYNGTVPSQQPLPANALPPAGPAAAPPLPSAPEDPFTLLIEKGQSLLNSGLNAVSHNAARILVMVVCSAFIKIKEYVNEEKPELKHLLPTIDHMIERLKKSKQGTWEELTAALKDAFKFMQKQQVYLQGFRLPVNPVQTHSSALPDFLQNIARHQNALQSPAQRMPQKVNMRMIEQQQKQLKARLATYAPAKLIAETFCRLKGNDAFYTELFKISDPFQEDFTSIFRERLFKKIDQTSLKFVTKWVAKGMFDLLLPVSAFYTDSFVDKFLSLTSDWIRNTPRRQHPKEELFIKLTRNWLAVTSAAYTSVANTPPAQVKDFYSMMEEAMKIPERNGGLTQNELFTAVAKTALDTFGPRIKWDTIIDNYFNAEIPPTSPVHFLNPLVRGINSFCSFCLKSFVFIPQWIGNYVLQRSAKFILSSTPILANYTEQTVESLRRNTPTSYAMQRVLYRQMQKILTTLQEGLNEEQESTHSPSNGGTNVNRVEIEGLVTNVFEVLSKSQYQTPDRLRNYLQNFAPLRDKIGREIDDAALPDLMEPAVKTISIAMKALIEEEELQQILFDSLCVANEAFDFTRVSISDQEFAGLEEGIRKLSDQVLETALFHAIKEQFDFTNKRQMKGITHFINTLKDQTSSFTQQLQLRTKDLVFEMPVDPEELVSKISSMIELSLQYNHGRVDALGKADGNTNFHSETKEHFNNLYKKLFQYCKPIADHLDNMKIKADKMVRDQKVIRTLFSCNSIISSLSEMTRLEQFSSGDFSFCRAQLSTLHTHLASLRRNPNAGLEIIIGSLESYSTSYSLELNKLEEIQKTQIQLLSLDHLFQTLKQEKLVGADTSQLEKEITQIALRIPLALQRELLSQSIVSLIQAKTPEGIESSGAEFSNIYIQISRTNSIESDRLMEGLRQRNIALKPQPVQCIDMIADRFEKNKKEIEKHKPELIKNSKLLQNMVQVENDLPIWNIFFADMGWFTELAKNLAFSRARGKIQQLFNSLYQRHFYIGFINQVALLPFLEKFGKNHLKK